MKRLRTRTESGGFTLIELLVVLAIIAVLAALLSPIFTEAKETAKCSTCKSNLKQLSVAVSMYLQDNCGRYPVQPEDGVDNWKDVAAKPNWAKSLERFVKLSKIPACPAAKGLSECRTNCTMPVNGISYPISYFGNGLLFRNGVAEGAITRSSKTVLFQCCGRVWNKCWVAPTWNEEYSEWESYTSKGWCAHNEGTNVAYTDGHIQWMKYEQLAANTKLFDPCR